MFSWEFGDSKDQMVSVIGSIDGFREQLTIEDYSSLSGLPVSNILSKCNFDEANQWGFYYIPEDQLDRVPAPVEALEEMYGDGFHLEVDGVKMPFQYVKSKCHLI